MSNPQYSFEKSPGYSLSITRSVTNFGAAEADTWQDLLKRPGSSKRERVWLRSMLRPARSPRAQLITSPEFKRFLGHAGYKEGVTEGFIKELGEHMEGVLADAPENVTQQPTLPSQVTKMGPYKVLSVTESALLIAERQQVQAELAEYLGLERVPSGVWVPDDYATRVWLARSQHQNENPLVNRLEGALQDGSAFIPHHTDFGKIAVTPVIPKH